MRSGASFVDCYVETEERNVKVREPRRVRVVVEGFWFNLLLAACAIYVLKLVFA